MFSSALPALLADVARLPEPALPHSWLGDEEPQRNAHECTHDDVREEKFAAGGEGIANNGGNLHSRSIL